jgi:hypothetical protein
MRQPEQVTICVYHRKTLIMRSVSQMELTRAPRLAHKYAPVLLRQVALEFPSVPHPLLRRSLEDALLLRSFLNLLLDLVEKTVPSLVQVDQNMKTLSDIISKLRIMRI